MKKQLSTRRKPLPDRPKAKKLSSSKSSSRILSPVQLGRIRTMLGPLHQADLASMMDISPAHVSLLVRGLRQPSVENAAHMAKILGVTVDHLLNTLAGA